MRFRLVESVETLIDKLNSFPMKKGMSKVSYEDITECQAILDQMPVGTKLKHEVEAGTEFFEKLSDGKYRSEWSHIYAPQRDEHIQSSFDIARWIAGNGNITRGKFEVI